MPEGTIFQEGISVAQNSSEQMPQNQPINATQNSSESDVHHKSNSGKIIKIGIFFFIILTIIFVILAFVNSRNNKKIENVTLTYWGVKEDASILEPAIKKFEGENPNIKVEYLRQDVKDYREKLTTRINSGNGPDVYEYHSTWFPMIRSDLLPFSQETISRQKFNDSFYSVAERDLIKNGAIYGIPTETDTLALYVNTALLNEASVTPPATWQEFIDASEKLTKRDEGGKITTAGAAIGTFENVNHAPDIISLLFAQNGVNFDKLSDFSEKISDALRFYSTFALTEDAVWDTTLDPSLSAFSQGKLAMYFGYYWDYFEIKSQNPNLEFKIYPVPQLLLNSKKNIANYWADGVSSQSKNQKEALKFIQFLAEEDTQRLIYQQEIKARSLGQPTGNKNLTEEFKDTESFVFADQSPTAVSSPFTDGTYDKGLNDKSNSLLKEIVNSLLDNSSPESLADDLVEKYSEIISSYSPKPTVK